MADMKIIRQCHEVWMPRVPRRLLSPLALSRLHNASCLRVFKNKFVYIFPDFIPVVMTLCQARCKVTTHLQLHIYHSEFTYSDILQGLVIDLHKHPLTHAKVPHLTACHKLFAKSRSLISSIRPTGALSSGQRLRFMKDA